MKTARNIYFMMIKKSRVGDKFQSQDRGPVGNDVTASQRYRPRPYSERRAVAACSETLRGRAQSQCWNLPLPGTEKKVRTSLKVQCVSVF
jgi:hypothetical protein